MTSEHDTVIYGLRERIISVVMKTYEMENLRLAVRARRFLPVGFHLNDIEISGVEQLMFGCVLSLKAEPSSDGGHTSSFEMDVFGEICFEGLHWEIQQISDVRASAQQTLW
jgi:hypothetical protein